MTARQHTLRELAEQLAAILPGVRAGWEEDRLRRRLQTESEDELNSKADSIPPDLGPFFDKVQGLVAALTRADKSPRREGRTEAAAIAFACLRLRGMADPEASRVVSAAAKDYYERRVSVNGLLSFYKEREAEVNRLADWFLDTALSAPENAAELVQLVLSHYDSGKLRLKR